MARFLRIAFGSASELEYHIILSTDLCYLNKSNSKHLIKQVTEVKRMLTSLIQKLTADSYRRFPAFKKRACSSPYVFVTGNCGNSLGR